MHGQHVLEKSFSCVGGKRMATKPTFRTWRVRVGTLHPQEPRQKNTREGTTTHPHRHTRIHSTKLYPTSRNRALTLLLFGLSSLVILRVPPALHHDGVFKLVSQREHVNRDYSFDWWNSSAFEVAREQVTKSAGRTLLHGGYRYIEA